jgi:branched-chain amino acid transport system permease protein
MGWIQNNGFLIVSMLINAVVALSVYVPYMTGQLSLASPGFYAIGGYTAALLSTKAVHTVGQVATFEPLGIRLLSFPAGSYPPILVMLEMVVAAIVCVLVALMIGPPALRLRGIYLALATMAFGELCRVLALNLGPLGGAVGIFGIPQPFKSALWYTQLALPLLLTAAFIVYRLEKVRAGRAFKAIREDELAANAVGIRPMTTKLTAFVVSGVLAGTAGVLAAHLLNTWSSRQVTFELSVVFVSFVVIGGSRTWLGPIAGAILLTALPEVLRAASGQAWLPTAASSFLRDGRLMVYGTLIVLCTIFFPRGLIRPRRTKATS